MEERRPPKVHAQSDAPSDAPSYAMQVLTTEHWSLLATRSQGFNEAFARAGLFLTILTGSVVALALVAQASEFDERFTTFALVLMPVVLFIGLSTLVRLVQNNFEDVQWVIGMNRIRHAYLEREPELAPYFVTSPYDDETGVMTTLGATPWREQMRGTHAFVTTPGMLAVVNATLAGVIAAMAASVVGTGPGIAAAAGVLGFLICYAALHRYTLKQIKLFRRWNQPRFPTPE